MDDKGKWQVRQPEVSLMDVILDDEGVEIIRVYEKGMARGIVEAHNAALDQTVCKKRTILDEEWEQKVSGAIVDKTDGFVCYTDWKQEIAALPDMARALKKIGDAQKRTMQGLNVILVDDGNVTLTVSREVWREIQAALEKAGIG